MKILAIGEIIWDVYPSKKCIGGAPLNFAAHSALLGAEVSLVSAVGSDELGRSALEYVSDFKIDSSFIKKNEKQTGVCDVTVDERGIPTYNVRTDTAYDNIYLTDEDTETINQRSYDLFYFGTLIQRGDSKNALDKILAECKFNDVFCDLNLRDGCYDKDSILTCLENATVLKMSDEEEPLLREMDFYENGINSNEKIAVALSESFPNLKIIIITMGEKGAFAYRVSDGLCVYKSARRVHVASTVGAGDSFCAAFCTELFRGKSLSDAMDSAIELSAFVVSKSEAVPLR